MLKKLFRNCTSSVAHTKKMIIIGYYSREWSKIAKFMSQAKIWTLDFGLIDNKSYLFFLFTFWRWVVIKELEHILLLLLILLYVL